MHMKSKFSKVHPLDMSNTTSTIIPPTPRNSKPIKEETKSSFWDRFRGK